uniref:ubiquitin-like-specific protease 1D isoform X2 n=1 Tax=Erigeron canadensis TaxID=72917 RepID=UPI001CB8B8F3|nr:ubiquitin-like-specific protease 1D isoform X2 [Erigeron canadensis]
MEIDDDNGTNTKKNPGYVDLNCLSTTSSDDDRPPELIIVKSSNKSDGEVHAPPQEDEKDDFELMTKTDHELNQTLARLINTRALSKTLPDKGEKLMANIRRHQSELEKRNKLKLEKAENGCEEMIQLSDHSDDSASCGEKKSDRKSSSSKFAKRLLQNMGEEKDSRTVNAFEKELSYVNPCKGRKPKPINENLDKERTKTGLLSKLPKTPLVDCENQFIFDDDKKDGDSTTSFSEPNSPQDPPTRVLRPRHKRNHHLLDEEIETTQYVEPLDPCMKNVKVYYPSRDDVDAVEVNYTDMACLDPEACLSSTIMNFYIRYLQQPTSSSDGATSSYHFFNTYFYNKLDKLNYKEDAFRKFRKWWKGVSILEKAYILLPIHENAHWSLVIICLPNKEDELGPMLLHLDSLGLHNSLSLFDNIKRFLREEWEYLRNPKTASTSTDGIWEVFDRKVDQKRVVVPQQKNDYDCGLFVLFYMERFIKEAPERLRKKDLRMFGKQWFLPEEASNLRGRIRNLLVEEFKKAKETESTSSP